MTQKEYNIRRNDAAVRNKSVRTGQSGKINQYDRRRRALSWQGQKYLDKTEEEYLPYAVFFRIRLALCAVLFAFFVYADKSVFTDEERTKVYQAMEENASLSDWKDNAAKEVFSIKSIWKK